MMLLVINLSRLIANIAWGILIIIVFIILYRLLLRRLKRKRPITENYFTLHPIEDDPAQGKIQLFFELNSEMPLKLSIYPINDEESKKELIHKTFNSGSHIEILDTTKFPNGHYFIEAQTDYQKTSKRFEIKN